eukprot:COSAG01_NODE_827_length_13280_cov_8.064107_7_plen_122_part_00
MTSAICCALLPACLRACVRAPHACVGVRRRCWLVASSSDQVESYPEVIRQAAATALARMAAHPVCGVAAGAPHRQAAAAVHAAFVGGHNGHKLNPVTRWSCLVALQKMGAAALLADALRIW